MVGPKTEMAQEVHADKYRSPGESFEEAMNRIASALTTKQADYKAFREILREQRFLPGGRVQSAAGSTKNVTAYNCFVSGVIADSFVDGKNSIMAMAAEAAATMRMGGGIGYDFSTLRPLGALIRKLRSHSSGPISFMEIFDAVCRCTASSGHRRGAQMGVLRIDHPDIEAFVDAKRTPGHLTGFNISVGVTDEFMTALRDQRPFELRFDGEVHGEINPVSLWDKIMRSNYDWAEPGVLFIDQINLRNNLHYCEQIAATNPCGEQPLPPYGACLLGSFCLPKYLYSDGRHWRFNHEQLLEDIPLVVAAMDQVIDVTTYPLDEQEQEAKRKRRMGLGVTGAANALEAMGMPYGSDAFCVELENILQLIAHESYRASVELAKRRGPFQAFDTEQYLQSSFVRALPQDIQDGIREHGIRNSHLTSIAPTGTISICADNVSSGIEPVFGYKTQRWINTPEGPKRYEAEDYGVRMFKTKGKVIADVTVEEHLAVMAAAARWVDSAVSKTCNFPEDVPWEDFKETYRKAYAAGCKGVTIYRYGCKREGIIEAVDEDEERHSAAACKIDAETGMRDCGE